jgi:hypothetical protein
MESQCKCGLTLLDWAEQDAGKCRFCQPSMTSGIRRDLTTIAEFGLAMKQAPSSEETAERRERRAKRNFDRIWNGQE